MSCGESVLGRCQKSWRCDEQILCVDYKYVSCGAQICLCGEQEESDKNTLEWISEK